MLFRSGLAFAVGFSWMIALRIWGVAPGIPIPSLEGAFPIVWAGFWLNALSGVPLAISRAVEDLTSPIFLTKLTFVILGFLATRRLHSRVFHDPGFMKTGTLPSNASTLAAVSSALWMCAIIAGRLNEYPRLLGLH